MKIISHQESRQILRNLYRRDAIQKYAEQLHRARGEERERILKEIEREIAERVRGQIVTGH
jgi:hypothetical protein